MLGHLVQHPLGRRHDEVRATKPIQHRFAVAADPRSVIRFLAVDSHPPTDNITVSNYDFRNADRYISVAVLAEVQDIGLNLADQQLKIALRFLNIPFCDLHPFELVFGWTKVEIVETLHPFGLVRKRQTTEADQSYAMTGVHESGDKFL